MKQTKNVISIVILLLSAYPLIGQTNAVLTYTGSTDLKSIRQANAFNSDVDPDMQMMILTSIMNSSKELTFELKINEGVSEFKCINLPLKKETLSTTLDITALLLGASDIYYFNKENNLNARVSKHSSKYLIQPENSNWTLHDEEKTINGYRCKKATISRKKYGRSGEIIDQITAYYTMDIPLEYGIQGFEGLPGVIVELSSYRNVSNNYKFELTNVELNKENPQVEVPRKKLINEREWQEIISKTPK